MLFGASGVLVETPRRALNTIWGVMAPTTKGFQSLLVFVKERLFSFALVLATWVFLLVVSLAVNNTALWRWVDGAQHLPVSEAILQVANALISFVVITALFAAIYRILLPDVRIEWMDVALGAAADVASVHGRARLDWLLFGQSRFRLHLRSDCVIRTADRLGLLLGPDLPSPGLEDSRRAFSVFGNMDRILDPSSSDVLITPP